MSWTDYDAPDEPREEILWFVPQRNIDTPGEREARQQLASMPYREYLRTPHWQIRRKRALQLAKYRCQHLGPHQGPLNVHHLNYDHRGCEEDEDLIVLCRRCHEIHHGIEP